MTEDQAHATRHLLVEEVAYFEARLRRERARSIGLLSRDEDNLAMGGDFLIRARLHREALQDLCEVFRLLDPMAGKE